MEVAAVLGVYILTVLIPINGLIWLGIRRERERSRRMLLGIWKMGNRR